MASSTTARDRTLGLVLVVAGALLLFAQLFGFPLGRYGWPLFVLIPGLLLFVLAALGGRSAAGLAVPGSVVSTIGLILLVQNLTGRFETWAYVWALIPTAVGLGLYLQGTWTASEKLRREGRRVASTGLVMLVAFGAFFELFIFQNLAGTVFGRLWVPAILIAAGVYLLYRRSQPSAAPEAGSRAEEPQSR
jgi:hypothetical protein